MVAYEGFAYVQKWQINRWFGQANFTVSIRREIRERWKTLGEDIEWIAASKLKIAKINDTTIILIKDTSLDDKKFYSESE
jgi:hypothetical protein